MLNAVVHRHLGEARCEFVRAVESAVTSAWGVRWDEVQIARDPLQNFYDANRNRLEAVTVTVREHDVMIAAPAERDAQTAQMRLARS